MNKYILALDQGTTSSRALVFDHTGHIRSTAQKEFKQHFPASGWVEHDPVEIWSSQAGVAAEAITRAGISPSDIAAIGITNQRETTLLWDRKTGSTLCNAIVWQDRRTAARCDQLHADGKAGVITEKTGLVPDAYFSATKLQWILNNIPDARRRAEKGELAFGTVDTWLLWQLTRGELHATDVSNASRTMLFNIHDGCWDDELLEVFGIPASVLPEVRPSSNLYGYSAPDVLGASIPMGGVAGDQQAALFGQMCIEPGMVKNTYGTGCFMLMQSGTVPVESSNNLLTTVAWNLGDGLNYALEGSIFVAGAVVQWLRDGLGLIRSSDEVEPLARSVEDNGGVYLVPAFTGLGAPHWDQYARGALVGITRATTAGHLARAALEGIAYQVADVVRAMEADSGIRLREVRVDGGAAVNDLLMQFQADMLRVPVIRPRVLETTALGAAYLAGLAVGFWEDVSELSNQWKAERIFDPEMPGDRAEALIRDWTRALERAKSWADQDV